MYTSRGLTASNQFKVHGQLPLYGMTIRESEDEWGVPHSFTLFGQRQSVVVAASSASEMEKWVEDIKMAIELADKCNGPSAEILSSSFTDSSNADQESEDDLSASRTSLERQTPHRGNTTVHVCWHRNTSVSMVDFSVALEVPEHSRPVSELQSLCLCLTFLSFSFSPLGTSHGFIYRNSQQYIVCIFLVWMEVIRSATCSSSHIRSLNRKEPHVY
uniref:PH domain-containing protein n=1 Tax=Cyprinus carpio TaxID=7962 RepID=A0A8C2EX70_CYPCA